VICARTAEPIEMLFGLRIWVFPWNCVVDGVHILHGKGQFYWEKGQRIEKYSDTLP